MLVDRSFCFFGGSSSSSSSDSSSSKLSYFLMLGKVIYGMRAFVLAHEKYHKSPNLINELQKHLTLVYPPIRQNKILLQFFSLSLSWLMNSKNTWHWLTHPLGKIKFCYNSSLSLSLSLQWVVKVELTMDLPYIGI